MKLVACLLLLTACSRESPAPEPPSSSPQPAPQPAQASKVRVWGALREMIHEGRIEGRVDLASVLTPRSHGLGALAGMQGEVTIVDGTPWIAFGLQDNGRASNEVKDASAALLVLADVPAWRDIAISADIAVADLDKRIEELLVANDVPRDEPVPFQLVGHVTARWHVLEGPPSAGANPHDHARNAVVGDFDGRATVVAVFSTKHQGVFTHRGHTVHAHVVDPASALAAHADELSVRAGAVLRVPAR